jgi:hypothetical protein
MNLGYSQTFLRRTAAVITAAASLLIADTAAAQTITLSGATGTPSCTYTSMSVQPNGNFVVNCASATPPTPGEAGTFSLSSATLSVQAGTTGHLTVNRSIGTTDAWNVPYAITGAGCTAASGNAFFASASAAAVTLNIAAVTASNTCTVTLSTPVISGSATTGTNAPQLGTNPATITVTAAAPPPPPGSCPTPPTTMLTGDLGLQGATQRPQMISGQVISFPLPTAFPAGSELGVVRAGETTATPKQTFFEATISKCPGEIKTQATGGTCYVGTYTQNLALELYWFYKLNGITAADANAMGGCVALQADGPYYLNVRWTYPVEPPWGYGSYVFQWQWGGM